VVPLTPAPSPAASAAVVATPSPEPAPTATPALPARSTAGLAAQVAALAAAAGSSQVSVALVELGGPGPLSWSYNADASLTAASTYKLPLLMAEAQAVAAGTATNGDLITFSDAEYEDGWYDDYSAGEPFTRLELAQRVGRESDNTAAHMLVDAMGGTWALNAYAAAHGATESAFYDPNTTTANDLARLWVNEAAGQAGGTAAQQWLYPLLTHTSYDAGIPAGVGSGATVVHKIGDVDSMVNDSALVQGGPKGNYVLVVMTDGPGGDAGWSLVAAISQAVWGFETAR
jgi:beta-lactamase class A